MKKFSKESMQQFMLMHAEKLILGACLAATGFFVWTSMGGEQKKAQTPSALKDKADRAESYVNKDAWSGENGLERFRQGKFDAKDQIANTQPVDGTKFRLDFGGSPAEALALRKDPAIFAPENMVAQRFRSGVMVVNPDPNKFVSPLSKFNNAPENLSGSGTKGSGTKGSGTKGGGSDLKDSSSDFDDSGSGTKLGADNELPSEFVPLDRGSEFSPVNALTSTGLRPTELGLADNTLIRVVDGVCITALVDYKKQSAAFENAYAESVAYNAKRDRPVYQFLQVQRREVAKEGEQSEWKDISEDVTYKFARSNPLQRMPFQAFGSAPEVSSPDNFDPILTQAIPAFAQFDYQKMALHPELKTRREYPAWKPPQEARELDNEIGWGQPEKKDTGSRDDDVNALRKGSETESYREAIVKRKPGGQYRLVRFFDLSAPKEKSFEYRVRVWLGDPNQLDPSDGFVKNRGQKLQPADGQNKRNNKDEVARFAGTGDGVQGMGDMADEGKRGGDDTRPEVVADVKPTMLVPPARIRITAGTDFDTMQEQFEEEAERLAEIVRLEEEGRRPPQTEDEFQPFHVAEYSAEGELEQIELPPSPSRYAYMQYLRYARPSAWSESVRVNKEKPTADVMAGTTLRKRSAIGVAGRSVEFDQVEPSIKVVVSSWNRSLKAKLPAERVAHIGETMNFNDQAYVTDPITWQIKVPEVPDVEGIKKYTFPFRTNVTIVDAFFGGQQFLPADKRLVMESATEVLTMDANGNLKISNQFDAAPNYRNELALPDDSRFYGKARPSKSKQKEEDEYSDEYQ